MRRLNCAIFSSLISVPGHCSGLTDQTCNKIRDIGSSTNYGKVARCISWNDVFMDEDQKTTGFVADVPTTEAIVQITDDN